MRPRCRVSSEVSRYVKIYREQRKLSQIALGRRAGFSPTYVSRIEIGDRYVHKRETVLEISKALNLGPTQRDHLLVAAGHAPSWTRDITVRQVVYLLRFLTVEQEKKLRRTIDKAVKNYCSA